MDKWSLSSSSSDDEDADCFQSEIREGSGYYERFLKGDYGTDDWADHIPQFSYSGLNNNNENRSSLANVTIPNGIMANNTLPCIVGDRIMLLNRDTNRLEVMRFFEISNGTITVPGPEINLPDSTMNGTPPASSNSVHSSNNSINVSVIQ